MIWVFPFSHAYHVLLCYSQLRIWKVWVHKRRPIWLRNIRWKVNFDSIIIMISFSQKYDNICYYRSIISLFLTGSLNYIIGNTHLSNKKYPEAVSSYSKAIQINANNAIYHSNRYSKIYPYYQFPSLCLLWKLRSHHHRYISFFLIHRAAAYSHMGQHEKAIEDCKQSIVINPSYSKAYGRLGYE